MPHAGCLMGIICVLGSLYGAPPKRFPPREINGPLVLLRRLEVMMHASGITLGIVPWASEWSRSELKLLLVLNRICNARSAVL